ncbi:MAG: hypothetical protein ACE5JJ_08740 [Nitrospinota bacterium]
MANYKGEERRELPRHSVAEGKVPILPVRYRVVGPPPKKDEGEKAASLFNLTSKGFHLRCPEVLPEGAIVELEVAYSPRVRAVGPLKLLKVRGEVRWCHPLKAPFAHEQYAAGIKISGSEAEAAQTAAKVAELIAYCQEASLLF